MTRHERIAHLISKSKESIRGAEILLSENMPDFSVSRAYYAMFYAAEAVLMSKGLEFSKHSGVIAAFKKEFVTPVIFSDGMSKSLRKAFDYRMQGDYSLAPVSREEANAVLAAAAEFINAVRDYLKKEGFLSK